MLRTMRLGGASSEAIEYSKVWMCPVCVQMSRPPKPGVASTAIRPVGFNWTVAMDVKYLKDVEGGKHIALSVVCAGTALHHASLLKTKVPNHVSQELLRNWIWHYGCPERVLAD